MFLQRVNDRLIEPPAMVQGAGARSRASLVAAASAIMTLLYIVLTLVAISRSDAQALWLFIGSLLGGALYGLSRTAHHEVARKLLPLLIFASALGFIVLNPGPESLITLVAPGLIAGFLWSSRGLIGLCTAEIIALLGFGPFINDPHAGLLILVFLTAMALIQLAALSLNDRMRHDLRQHTSEHAASETRFRTLIDNSPDAYYLLRSVRDAAQNIVDFEMADVNEAGLLYAQQTREQLVGTRLSQQMLRYLIDQAFERCKAVVETGHSFTDDVTLAMPDGIRRWYSVIGVPVDHNELAIISRDITERKATEEALHESETRFHNLADSAPVLMWVTEPDKQITYFNRAWLTFTGRSLSEEAGYGWVEVVHPEDRETCVRIYEESFDARQPYQMIYRLRRHDDVYRWVLEYGVPRFTDEPAFLGFMGSAVDITDQKLTEQALRASQAYLRAAVESLPFEFWAHDLDGHTILQNAHSIEVWGSVIGHTNEEHDLPEAVLEEWEENNRQALAGDVVRKEVVYSSDSGPRYTYNIVVPVRDGDDILGITGVNIDITETKQMEAKLRALLEAMPDFMARISRGGMYLEVVHGTDFKATVLDERPVGRSIYDILPAEVADLRMTYIHRALETGLMQTYEYPFQTTSGELRQFEARVAVSGPDEALVILRDVTARKNAEAHALDLALERERITLLRRFVGDRTHDLMTPLTIFKTSLYLLTKTDSPQRRIEHVHKLEAQVDHLESMIRNMLMILRLDKPVEDEFEFVMEDLNALVEHVVAMHQPVAISRQQILTHEGFPSLPLLMFDHEKLEQALANLVDNALKYTGSGGSVRVTIGIMGDDVCVAVYDNGRGIAPEDLTRIFDRFFRSDTTKTWAGGSGLGLAIVDKIVRAHGGRVEVESAEGSGSIFRVFLPLPIDQAQMALFED